MSWKKKPERQTRNQKPETPFHSLWQNNAETVAPNYSQDSDSVARAARLLIRFPRSRCQLR